MDWDTAFDLSVRNLFIGYAVWVMYWFGRGEATGDTGADSRPPGYFDLAWICLIIAAVGAFLFNSERLSGDPDDLPELTASGEQYLQSLVGYFVTLVVPAVHGRRHIEAQSKGHRDA